MVDTNPPTRTLTQRLVHTPLRDLLRGRLSGRLDRARLLAESGLPAAARAVVEHVVRKTRLKRLERVDVTCELIAHFRDGEEAGRPVDQLITEFGDPNRTARLIRRAKIRSRHWLWHAMRYMRNTILALIGLYILAGLYYLTGEVNPTVDYVARLTAEARAVPEKDRAWPLYREALLMLDEYPAFEDLSREPRPGEIGWEEAAVHLEASQEALAIARRAAHRPALGFVARHTVEEADLALFTDFQAQTNASADDDPMAHSLISILLPHLAKLRLLGKTFVLDARRAAAEGDGRRVVDDCVAIIRIGAHLRETPTIINDLVTLALVALACDTINGILAEHPDALTDDQLHELAHELAAIDELFTVRFDGERMMFADVVQRLYTDDGEGDGHLTMRGMQAIDSISGVAGGLNDRPFGGAAEVLFAPAVNAFVASRAELTDEYQRIMNMLETDARRPLWERHESRLDTLMQHWHESYLRQIRYAPIYILVPALDKVAISAEQGRQIRDATLVVIALELHRREQGDWPQTLEALTPRLLPEVPHDRFDGRPLRYAVGPEGPIVYSVGSDRDDDGGVPPVSASAWPRESGARRWLPPDAVASAADGDWVLWPPNVEEIRRYETDEY